MRSSLPCARESSISTKIPDVLRNRLNVPLSIGAIAKRLADDRDVIGEISLFNKRVGPDLLQQFIFFQQTSVMLDQRSIFWFGIYTNLILESPRWKSGDHLRSSLPQQADFYSNRGRVWLMKDEYDRALDDLNRALAIDPKLAEAWSYRGVAWSAKRDFTRAITDFNQALKLNPRLAGAYCSRGATRMAQGKLEEAEADVARCRELGGDLMSQAAALLREMKQCRAAR